MGRGILRRAALRTALAAGAGTTALGALAVVPAAAHAAPSLPAADVPMEYRTPGGRYFGQTGFAVLDEAGGPQFWAGMRHLGGIQVLGYPISRPYLAPDGLRYQAFQRGVLQWRPDSGETWLANVMDWLHNAGHDDWLLSLGVPRQRADDGSLHDFAQIKAARLGWLTNALIKRHFMQAGAAQPSPQRQPGPRGSRLWAAHLAAGAARPLYCPTLPTRGTPVLDRVGSRSAGTRHGSRRAGR